MIECIEAAAPTKTVKKAGKSCETQCMHSENEQTEIMTGTIQFQIERNLE